MAKNLGEPLFGRHSERKVANKSQGRMHWTVIQNLMLRRMERPSTFIEGFMGNAVQMTLRLHVFINAPEVGWLRHDLQPIIHLRQPLQMRFIWKKKKKGREVGSPSSPAGTTPQTRKRWAFSKHFSVISTTPSVLHPVLYSEISHLFEYKRVDEPG
jgi:hypothetical protein